MGKKKGPDPNKLKKIVKVLREKPQGLWIREIARQTGISKSTTHRYVTEYMSDQIEEVVTVKGGLVKFVRLKEK
ncbi:MAG: helix-turn-helix domain-containing protein [Candidatus Aenigmarchaeota archaeon]|nr:helix-turn-helix domain-containing protein [Candidatus Aenigmarchaeota archaeon]